MDAGLQIIYFVVRGYPTWSVPRSADLFNVRGFTYLVGDERYISIKSNYRHSGRWSITTDEYGFRSGDYKASTINNIAFIGDSVPFGWGVNSDHSVPNKLNEILLSEGIDIGIINAAIPSYSLDQAVHRYKYEIANNFPVSVIILQIYAPVPQFALYPKEWNSSYNWTTEPLHLGRFENYPSLVHYSSLGFLYWKYGYLRYFRKPAGEITSEAIDRYRKSITASLEILLNEIHGSAKLLLLPVNAPKNSRETFSDNHKTAIRELNSTFLRFSNNRDRVFYLDIISSFDDHHDELLFIDSCCHLSSEGAEIQAQQIYQKLKEIEFEVF